MLRLWSNYLGHKLLFCLPASMTLAEGLLSNRKMMLLLCGILSSVIKILCGDCLQSIIEPLNENFWGWTFVKWKKRRKKFTAHNNTVMSLLSVLFLYYVHLRLTFLKLRYVLIKVYVEENFTFPVVCLMKSFCSVYMNQTDFR